MDFLSIINNYVKLSVQKIKLEKTIEIKEKNISYSKVEGDISYAEGDFEAEQSYNNSILQSKKDKEKAEQELTQIIQLLNAYHNQYINTVESLSIEELNKKILELTKINDCLINEVNETIQKRKVAIENGDIAYMNNDLEAEEKFNEDARKAYLIIEEKTPYIGIYNAFIANIKSRIEQRNFISLIKK